MNLFRKFLKNDKGFAPIIAIIVLALVAAAVPTTIILVQQEQDNRQLANSSGLPDGTELCATTIEYYECNGNEILVKSQKDSGKITNRPTCIAGSVCEVSSTTRNCVKCVAPYTKLPPTSTPTLTPTPQYGCDSGYSCVTASESTTSSICDTSQPTRPARIQCTNHKGVSAVCCKNKDVAAPPAPEVSDTCTASVSDGDYSCQANGCNPPLVDTGQTGQTLYTCLDGKTCCFKAKAGVVINPGNGGGGTGGNNPAPTLPEPGVGYCANENRENDIAIKGGNCGVTNATWVGPGTNPYCVQNHPNSAEYFYECSAVVTPVPTATPTPTPYAPTQQGGICTPSQGPWQCESPNVCIVAIGEGRCCPADSEWKNNECTPIITPTPEPPAAGVTNTPTLTPTPVDTGDTCNDYIPESNIHQVCRVGSCNAGESENAGGNQTCSTFYRGNNYKCCQLPQGSGPAGSSCNKPNRECNPSQNTNTGTNDACSGCGGYCVGNSGTSGTCQSL